MAGAGDRDEPGRARDALAETIDASTDPAAAAGASTPPPAGSTPGGSTSPTARGVLAVGPGTILGRFEIVDELGAGGMATVYRARDPQLRREVAIKVMFPHLAKKPDVARRFQREARAAAGLEHPNVLRVYDVGGGRTDEGPDEPPHIVMELVRGRSLRELVDAHGPMLAEVVACLGAVLCDALGAAHARGVIHRDVKPGNVMVTDDGRMLLADFGVARIDDDDSLVTKTGALLGTPSYMAPEQAVGDAVDARSDLYSLGATLYQLATGSVPFSGPTAVVVAAIARGEYTAPLRRRPAIGGELARAIQKLMAKEPAQRPASAEEAAALLRQVARDGGFGEPREEVAAFLRDPAGFEKERTPKVVARAVARAEDAIAARALPKAMALLDRVLAIEPEHAAARALAERIAPSRHRSLLLLVGAAVAAAAVGGGIALAVMRSSGGPDSAAAAADAAPVATADAAPVAAADAAPAADAAAAPDAAVLAPRRDAGPRRIDAGVATSVADAAPAPTLPPDARPEPPPDARPVERATVTITVDAWCDLSIDGGAATRLDRKKSYTLDAGTHELVCTQGRGRPTWRDTITLAPGAHERVTASLLGTVRVTVRVTGGDAVRIGGTRYANGAKVDLKPGRVRVEVLKGSNAVTAAWLDLPRVAACTLDDRPDLACAP